MRIIAGKARGTKLYTLEGENTRPTLDRVKESLFNIIQNKVQNSIFLDLFSGSGIMGFEAISRGFSHVSFIEKDKKTFFLLKDNAKKLEITAKQADFFCGDSLKIIKKLNKTFDVIYVDPPYMSGLYDNVLIIVKELSLLNENGIIILEHPKNLEINKNGYELIKQKTFSDKIVSFLHY